MRRPCLTLLLALLSTGCVYTSAVPLDDPGSAPVDEVLLGSWVPAEDATSEPVTVRRADGGEYRIEWYETQRENGTHTRTLKHVRAFVTIVDGVRFLNIQDPEDGRYSFLSYRAAGDELRLRFIAEATDESERGLREQFTSSAALREVVYQRRQDPLLYEDAETVLRRVRP